MKFFLILLLKTNLLLFLVLFATEAFSQSKAIDSLKKIVEIKKEDTTKVNALIELSRVSVDSSNAVQSANDALMMAKKINYKKGEGIANLRIAEMNMHFHKNDEAVKNSFDALRLFQEIKDDNNAVNAYNSIALSYYYQSNFSEARKFLFTAMQLGNKIGDKEGMGRINMIIADTYVSQQKNTEGLKYNYAALKIYEKLDDKRFMAFCLLRIGIAHESQGDLEEAQNNFIRCLKLWEDIGDKSNIASLNNRVGSGYLLQGKYNEALQKHLIAVKIAREIKNGNLMLYSSLLRVGEVYEAQGNIADSAGDKVTAAKKYADALKNYTEVMEALEKTMHKGLLVDLYPHFGSVYTKLKKYDLAKDYFEKALSLSKSHRYNNHITLLSYAELSKIESMQQNYQKAFEYYKAYVVLKDSAINDSTTKQVVKAKLQYEFDKEADSLKLQQQLTDEKLKQQKFLAIQQQQQLQIKETSLTLSNQQKELNQLAFLRTEAELKTEQTQRQDKEKQLTIVEKEKALQQASLKLKTTELGLKDKEVESKKMERNFFVAGAVIFLFLGLILLRNNRHKQKAYTLLEKQKLETDQQKEKVESTLTELKATQAQLIQSEKMASLGELTAGIAHEIQNPLNFVNNFSEVNKELVDELQTELKAGNTEGAFFISNEIKENEQKINHHGKRADAIVKGMLQHSRASTGVKEPTDINALADEYLRLSYHGLRAKDKDFNADFKTDFDESIGKIEVVQQDIGRVLLNLYNNAFYAVNERLNAERLQPNAKEKIYQPSVLVTTKKLSDTFEIRIADNGNGIPKKVVDKIFQPFFTTKPTGKGTGLGLSLSYDIVKAHGGEMKVDSREVEGAEFIIQLPLP